MTSFSWLHLTDLHLGMGEQPYLFPGIKDRFFEDLKPLHEKCGGPWDLVLFTGDLTQSGKEQEFASVNDFLDELWDRLDKLGSHPSLLAVPGNHDLVRPKEDSADVIFLVDWVNQPKVRGKFWKEPDCSFRKAVNDAFKNYVDWWEKTPFKKLPVQKGELPGDFSVTFEKEGATLGIVGLNSTFLQLAGGDYTGKLALHALQFQSPCNGDGPGWAKKHNACLLLTHQPPDWLTKDSREDLRGEIAVYFNAHLFGHMHESRYQSAAEAGGPIYRTCQGMSLFGMEYFGEDQKKERLHGYSAGKIELQGDEGSLELWPRKASRPGGGPWNFASASDAFFLTDEHTNAEAFKLWNPVPPPSAPNNNSGGAAGGTIPPASQKRYAILIGGNDYEYFTKPDR